jgi:hypothetical protein
MQKIFGSGSWIWMEVNCEILDEILNWTFFGAILQLKHGMSLYLFNLGIKYFWWL